MAREGTIKGTVHNIGEVNEYVTHKHIGGNILPVSLRLLSEFGKPGENIKIGQYKLFYLCEDTLKDIAYYYLIKSPFSYISAFIYKSIKKIQNRKDGHDTPRPS